MCRRIVQQAVEIRENLRVELTLRGEPTLNPYLLQNLKIIREVAPKFQISLFTNGVKFSRNPGLIKSILDAGVNILCVECYNETHSTFQKIAEAAKEVVVDFRKFSAYRRYSNGHTLRVVNLIPDIMVCDVPVRKIHNNAGNVDGQFLHSRPGYPSLKLPLQKKCCRPFRELVVYHTGDVVICCHDWKAAKILGNVKQATLFNIWYGVNHLKVLKHLYGKSRTFLPCSRCDYFGGYRTGLLTDPTKV